MDKFSSFRIDFCKPTRSLWFKKKKRNRSSAKEAQTTVKSSQKKAKAASGKKETKLLKRMRKKGHKLLLKMQETQVKTDAGSAAASTDKATDSSQMVPEELVGTGQEQLKLPRCPNDSGCGQGTVTMTANFIKLTWILLFKQQKPKQFKHLVMSITGKQTNLALFWCPSSRDCLTWGSQWEVKPALHLGRGPLYTDCICNRT